MSLTQFMNFINEILTLRAAKTLTLPTFLFCVFVFCSIKHKCLVMGEDEIYVQEQEQGLDFKIILSL